VTVSFENHLSIEPNFESKARSTITTTIGQRPEVHSDFTQECIGAAKKIAALTGSQDKIALLLDESYESAVTFLAFHKAGIPIKTYFVDFKNLTEVKKKSCTRVQQWVKSLGAEVSLIPFDLKDPQHLESLEKLKSSTGCNNIDQLFKIWASCNIDEFLVLPGSFVHPVFDQFNRVQNWSLPGYSQLSLFNFFKEFGGIPFFLCFSPSLIYSQVDSAVTSQLLAITQGEERTIDPNSNILKKMFAQQAFSEELNHLELAEGIKPFSISAVHDCDRGIIDRYLNLIRGMNIVYEPKNLQNISVRPENVNEIVKNKSYLPEIFELSENSDLRGNIHPVPVKGQNDSLTFAAFSTYMTANFYKGDVQSAIKHLEALDFFNNGMVTTTTGDLHLHPEIESLIDFFKESVELYFQQMGYTYDIFYITECWANRYEDGQYFHYHYHPNSYLSGIFYLTSGGGGNTVFKAHEKHEIVPKIKRRTKWNASYCHIAPEAGTLILYPSHLDHKTLPHKDSNRVRYTIAFNVMINGV
jgi:uncharacterized protein (TIGR02466 family)